MNLKVIWLYVNSLNYHVLFVHHKLKQNKDYMHILSRKMGNAENDKYSAKNVVNSFQKNKKKALINVKMKSIKRFKVWLNQYNKKKWILKNHRHFFKMKCK